MPERSLRPRIVCTEQNRQHVQERKGAGRADANSSYQRQTDGEFAVGDEEGDRGGVRKDKTAQHGDHEWVGTFFEKFVDPELKAAVQGELGAEDLILAENKEENSDGNAQEGQGFCVCGVQVGCLVHRFLACIAESPNQTTRVGEG